MINNKDKIKQSLTIEQVYDLVAELGGEPQMRAGHFVARTICHNPPGEGSYKLYYYENTQLFRCFTSCSDTFDIFDLVRKHMQIKTGADWSLPKTVSYVANYFNIFLNLTNDFSNDSISLKDWEVFNKYDKINSVREEQIVQLKTYDDYILQRLPQLKIPQWEAEGISAEVMKQRGIRYDPINEGIVIPHYDINGQLIGIRERTLIQENEKFGKYIPAKINGIMYNHPLSFNLYNLNNSKENIKAIKKVIVFESEKATMQYASYFGSENDISVAVCGSNLINYQVKQLLDLGVEEIIIAFDKQFKEIGDTEWDQWTKKLANIHTKYGAYVQISFLFDKYNYLPYKASPIDVDIETFLKLFKERIYL